MRIFIKYLVILIVFASCKHETNNSQKKKEIDFDAVSIAVCNCYVNSGLNSLNEELSALQEKDAPREDMKKLTEKAEVLYTKMKSCIDSVESKYGKIDSDDNKQKAENALKKNCPQLAPFYDDIK
jgi:hypothetical protein